MIFDLIRLVIAEPILLAPLFIVFISAGLLFMVSVDTVVQHWHQRVRYRARFPLQNDTLWYYR